MMLYVYVCTSLSFRFLSKFLFLHSIFFIFNWTIIICSIFPELLHFVKVFPFSFSFFYFSWKEKYSFFIEFLNNLFKNKYLFITRTYTFIDVNIDVLMWFSIYYSHCFSLIILLYFSITSFHSLFYIYMQ